MNVNLKLTGPKTGNAGTQNAATLFVSLYVVVLAFFILLTANAQFDAEKSRNVMDSVNKAFAAKVKVDTDWVMESVGNEISAENVFSDVQAVITSVVPVEELKIITDGPRMFITLPVSSLFREGSAELRADRAAFYRRLSTALTTHPQESGRMSLEFIQGSKKNTPITDSTYNLHIARAGNFAREMENRGVPPESLTIGVEQANPNRLLFEFSVRPTAATPEKHSISTQPEEDL